jgi:hypothetical protein
VSSLAIYIYIHEFKLALGWLEHIAEAPVIASYMEGPSGWIASQDRLYWIGDDE